MNDPLTWMVSTLTIDDNMIKKYVKLYSSPIQRLQLPILSVPSNSISLVTLNSLESFCSSIFYSPLLISKVIFTLKLNFVKELPSARCMLSLIQLSMNLIFQQKKNQKRNHHLTIAYLNDDDDLYSESDRIETRSIIRDKILFPSRFSSVRHLTLGMDFSKRSNFIIQAKCQVLFDTLELFSRGPSADKLLSLTIQNKESDQNFRSFEFSESLSSQLLSSINRLSSLESLKLQNGFVTPINVLTSLHLSQLKNLWLISVMPTKSVDLFSSSSSPSPSPLSSRFPSLATLIINEDYNYASMPAITNISPYLSFFDFNVCLHLHSLHFGLYSCEFTIYWMDPNISGIRGTGAFSNLRELAIDVECSTVGYLLATHLTHLKQLKELRVGSFGCFKPRQEGREPQTHLCPLHALFHSIVSMSSLSCLSLNSSFFRPHLTSPLNLIGLHRIKYLIFGVRVLMTHQKDKNLCECLPYLSSFSSLEFLTLRSLGSSLSLEVPTVRKLVFTLCSLTQLRVIRIPHGAKVVESTESSSLDSVSDPDSEV